jgi:selenoprotein W-related protein
MNSQADNSNKPGVRIRYCTGCRWLMRAAWLAQELLSTFEAELGEVTLVPDATGGVFDVHIDDQLVWSRAEQQRFPEPKEIKQAVRDIVAPGRDLGHVDH